MKKKKLISMLMTAVLTFTSVAPQPALYANAEGDVIIEEVSEEDTVSDNDSGETPEEGVSENEAVEDTVSENEPESASENEADDIVSEDEPGTVSGNDTTETELPDGIKGMPEGYTLSGREADIKADMISHDVLGDLKNAVAGADYVEDRVYCIADTEEYAQEIAEAYGIELVEYTYNVAIFDIKESGRDVPETVELGLDTAYQLPPLTPDYIYQDPESETGNGFLAGINAVSSGQPVNMPGDWESVRELMGEDMDPLLKPGDPNYQWWHDMVDSYAAWGVYGTDYSASGIKVAVLDGRVNGSHEDLTGNVKAVDVTGGGSSAVNGHGTQAAGIIGAKAANGKGGAGIAPGVQMYSLSAAKENGNIEGAYVTACLKYLENSDADIACMSFAGIAYDANQKEAIQKAYEKNITLLAPAGDTGADSAVYPAQYDHVISVGAVKQDGSKMITSGNTKSQADVYAPGIDMMSTYSDGSYKAENGSSMACAAAAGACALYMSIKGKTGPDEMEKVLTGNTIKGKSLEKAVGIVNIPEMLGAETAGPRLELYDHTGLVKTVESGATAGATVYSMADIVVTPMLRSGEVNTDKDLQIFFTLDGKTPSFKDGVANEGTYYLTKEEYYDTAAYVIELDHFVDRDNERQRKMTLKVVCVMGSGEVSKVTTLKLNVKPVWSNYELYITDVPEGKYEVSSGGTLKMKAVLFKETLDTMIVAKPKNLKWEVIDGKDIAGIGKKNGLLKTVKGKTGKVVIRCSCKENGYQVFSSERTLYVGEHAPVKSFTISESNLELSTGTGSTKVRVTGAVDINGDDILDKDYVKYSWTSSNTKVAYPTNDYGKETGISPAGRGTAIITCTAKDGSNAQVKIKVTVKNKVASIEITGQDCVVAGGSASYKAKAYGKRDKNTNEEIYIPSDKRVIWFLNGDSGCTELDGGAVKIDPKKGTVRVDGNVSTKEFSVCAGAIDGSGIYASKPVNIQDKKTTSIIIKAENTEAAKDDAYNIRLDKNGSIASMQLYTVDADSSPVIETWLGIRAGTDSLTRVSWKSSNEEVVSVSGSPWTATLKAKGVGTAKITCTANDGSGRKTSFIVKVIVPVSHVMITDNDHAVYPGGADGISYTCVEKGKVTSMQTVAGDSYGKPGNTKVKWSYEIVGYDDNNRKTILDKNEVEKAEKAKLFTINGGKIKINKDYDALCKQNGLSGKIGVLITATSTDGTNVSDSMLVIPVK